MRGYYQHHTGDGFVIRMAAGERTIDLLQPRVCAECGCQVDPELCVQHRKHCTVAAETLEDLAGRTRRQLGDGS